jgi:hypothetical protein
MPSLVSSSISRKRPSRSITAATVTEGFQTSVIVSLKSGRHFTAGKAALPLLAARSGQDVAACSRHGREMMEKWNHLPQWENQD